VDAHLQPGQSLLLPEAEERAVYVAEGALKVGESTLPEYSLAVFSAEDEVVLDAVQEARITIIGGETLGRRYIEWNFVSSRKERIEQAKADWKNGRFPKVPGDEEEFIPLPE